MTRLTHLRHWPATLLMRVSAINAPALVAKMRSPWARGLKMLRREFIRLLGGAAASWPLVARAQQPERRRRIGVLMGIAADDEAQSRVTSFRDALAKLGWAEGSNLQIEVRWSAGDAEKIRMFAKELVDLRLGAILGQSTPVMVALVRETQTISGGTGRFSGASGTIILTRTLDLATGSTSGTYTGTINQGS